MASRRPEWKEGELDIGVREEKRNHKVSISKIKKAKIKKAKKGRIGKWEAWVEER